MRPAKCMSACILVDLEVDLKYTNFVIISHQKYNLFFQNLRILFYIIIDISIQIRENIGLYLASSERSRPKLLERKMIRTKEYFETKLNLGLFKL